MPVPSKLVRPPKTFFNKTGAAGGIFENFANALRERLNIVWRTDIPGVADNLRKRSGANYYYTASHGFKRWRPKALVPGRKEERIHGIIHRRHYMGW
jgi:hypothetical protein